MKDKKHQAAKIFATLILTMILLVSLIGHANGESDNQAFVLEGLDDELLVGQQTRGSWGSNWSAPTTSGIIFGYLAQRDYPKLVPDSNGDGIVGRPDVEEVTDMLGKEYTDTHPQQGTRDPNLVEGLARYLNQKYPDEFVLKVHDSDFPQEFLQLKGKSVPSKLHNVPILLRPDPEFEDYQKELIEGEMVWLGIPKEKQEDNHFLAGRSFVPTVNSLGDYPVDLVDPYESPFSPGQAQIIETTMSPRGVLAYQGKRIKSDILIALSPREKKKPGEQPAATEKEDGDEGCSCGSWQDLDGNGIPDVEIAGEVVNITGDYLGFIMVPSGSMPMNINPGYQCSGANCEVTYDWKIEEMNQGIVVGQNSGGHVSPPIGIGWSDLSIPDPWPLNYGPWFTLTIKSYCNGEYCDQVKIEIDWECDCGEWDEVEVEVERGQDSYTDTVQCGWEMHVPENKIPTEVTVTSSLECPDCYTTNPSYSWNLSQAGGNQTFAHGQGNTANFDLSSIVSTWNNHNFVLTLDAYCGATMCSSCIWTIRCVEPLVKEGKTDKPDLKPAVTDCTYSIQEGCIKWKRVCTEYEKYCKEWRERPKPHKPHEEECVDWGTRCVERERVCQERGKTYVINLDFLISNVGGASSGPSTAEVKVLGPNNQSVTKKTLITGIDAGGQQVARGLTIETEFEPVHVQVIADSLGLVDEADEGNNSSGPNKCQLLQE